MNRLLLGAITACIVTIAALQSPLMHHSIATFQGKASRSPSHAGRDWQPAGLRTRTWRGLSLRVPASWRELANTDDHATWGSRDRRQTVTLGAALDPHRDITEAARAASPAIAAAAPGGRVTEVSRLSDLAGSVRVRVQPTKSAGGRELLLEQSWTRIPRADLIAIASWTDSAGVWPRWARTELPYASAAGDQAA